jgi:membrane protein
VSSSRLQRLGGDRGTEEQVPSWAVVLSALVLAIGLSRSRAGAAASAGHDAWERETERGRTAETPSQIPARGWNDILLRVYRGITQDRIFLVAAGVTFYALLAIFPGIAALISTYGLFADPANVAGHVDSIASIAPGGAVDVLRDQLTRLASQGGTKLGVSFLISLSISLWTANSGVKALFDALNISYEEEEKRGFLRLTIVTLLITIGIIAFILLSIGAVVALPVVLNYLPQLGMTSFLVKVGRWPILFLLVTMALQLLYRYGPSRKAPRWRWVSWGVFWRRSCGWLPRPCSPGTSRVSATTTKPMALSARSSAS